MIVLEAKRSSLPSMRLVSLPKILHVIVKSKSEISQQTFPPSVNNPPVGSNSGPVQVSCGPSVHWKGSSLSAKMSGIFPVDSDTGIYRQLGQSFLFFSNPVRSEDPLPGIFRVM